MGDQKPKSKTSLTWEELRDLQKLYIRDLTEWERVLSERFAGNSELRAVFRRIDRSKGTTSLRIGLDIAKAINHVRAIDNQAHGTSARDEAASLGAEVREITAPPLGERLIALLAIPERREAILGDLAEQFADRVRRCGADRARRWYWCQVALSGGAFAWRWFWRIVALGGLAQRIGL